MRLKKPWLATLACLFGLVVTGTSRADLIAYWPLDDSTGNLGVGDATLQLSGDAAFSTAQVAPGNGGTHSLQVDGADDFAYVNNANGLDTIRDAMGRHFTVSMWARSDVPSSAVTNNGLAYLFDIGASHGDGAGVFFNQSHPVSTNDQIGAYYTNSGISTGTAGVADTWYHVTLTGDDANVALYVDGVHKGADVTQDGAINISNQFRLGAEAKSTGREWKGFLDDVAIFNEKLSTTQIANLAAGASPTTIASQSRVLMLVSAVDANGKPTSGDDLAVYNRLTTTLGHDVTVVDDDVSATADAHGHDLVLVSGSVGSGNIGNKFNYLGIPVINHEAANWDDFKLSGSGNRSQATDLDILLPDHPLAAGLTAGTHTVVTQSSEFSGGTAASLGTGATVIANVVGLNRPGIVEYRPGDMLSDQGSGPALPAPAERIGYFFCGADGGLGAQYYLNTDGLALFDAAVDHAMQEDPTLRVDFGTGTQDLLPGFLPFERGSGGSINLTSNSETETYLSPLATDGTLDVTIGTNINSLGFRDRGNGTQGALGDLYEDQVKTNGALGSGDEELTLTFDGLAKMDYTLVSFHHNIPEDTGDFDIFVDDAFGFRQIASSLSQTNGNPGGLTYFDYRFSSNGIDPVTFTFREIAGSAPNNPELNLNGFILIQQVPEPSSVVLFVLGGLGLIAMLKRRRR